MHAPGNSGRSIDDWYPRNVPNVRPPTVFITTAPSTDFSTLSGVPCCKLKYCITFRVPGHNKRTYYIFVCHMTKRPTRIGCVHYFPRNSIRWLGARGFFFLFSFHSGGGGGGDYLSDKLSVHALVSCYRPIFRTVLRCFQTHRNDII